MHFLIITSRSNHIQTMVKKTIFLLFATLVFIASAMFNVSASTYNNTCDGKLAWIHDVTDFAISKQKLTTHANFLVDNFNTTQNSDIRKIIYFPLQNNSVGDSDTTVSNIANPTINNGTISEAIFIQNGRLGQKTLSFDGIDDFVSVPFTQNINVSTSGGATMAAWVKYSANPSTDIYTIGSYGNGEFTMGITNSTPRELACNFAGLTDTFVSSFDEIIQPDTWTHVVCFYDGTNIGGYVNGILDDTDPSTGNIGITSAGINLGRRTTNARRLNGSISEFVVFNRSLTPSEVNQLYLGSNKGDWKLRGNSGTSLKLSNISKEGTASLNFTYNMTGVGFDWIELNNSWINVINATDYASGVGFWYKGDGSTNEIFAVKIVENSSNDGVLQYNFAVDGFEFPLSSTDWRYAYLDFSQFNNKSTDGIYMTNANIRSIVGLVISVKTSDNVTNYSSILIDDINFVDFDKGSFYYFRTEHNTSTLQRDGRWQENIYSLAYQYTNGTTNYLNNESVLNATLFAGDFIAATQQEDNGIVEVSGFYAGNPVATGNNGAALIKALMLLKDNPRMQDNITIHFHENITTKTRIEIWNETVERFANYSYNQNLPFQMYSPIDPDNETYLQGTWYANQFTSAIRAEYLYYLYSNKSIYKTDVDNKLIVLNNTWQLNQFGLLPEANKSGTSACHDDNCIGFDPKYYMVGLTELAIFYQDYNSTILADIIQKHDKLLLNAVGKNGTIYNVNSTRGNDFENKQNDRSLTRAAQLLNMPYLKQQNYKINQITLGYGNSQNGAGFAGTTPFKAFEMVIHDYLACSYEPTDTGFKFPQEYDRYFYKESSQVLNSSTKYRSGNLTTIPQNVLPSILYAYDLNSNLSYSSPNAYEATQSIKSSSNHIKINGGGYHLKFFS